MWQLCPKCEGEGKVKDNSPPIGTTPINTFYSSKRECPVCLGGKVISLITGNPPAQFLPKKKSNG